MTEFQAYRRACEELALDLAKALKAIADLEDLDLVDYCRKADTLAVEAICRLDVLTSEYQYPSKLDEDRT